MEQLIQKPATDIMHSVDQITINVNTKQAIIRVTKTVDGEQSMSTKVVFDIIDFLNDEGYTEAQILGIKNMYKQMIAKAWGILESELTDDIFIDTIEEPIV